MSWSFCPNTTSHRRRGRHHPPLSTMRPSSLCRMFTTDFWVSWFLIVSIFHQQASDRTHNNNNGSVWFCHASVIDINWKFPVVSRSLPPQVANVGDTVRFSWIGTHNVYIHPTMDCRTDGRIFVGDTSGANYTFSDGGTVLFACDFQNHCDRGLYMEFTVLRAGETPPPFTLPPTASPIAESGGSSTLNMLPTSMMMMILQGLALSVMTSVASLSIL